MKRSPDVEVIHLPANIRACTGVTCDNAWLVRKNGQACLFTDFRYIPMVRRTAPRLSVRDLRRFAVAGKRIGYEAGMTVADFNHLKKLAPRATFVDISRDLASFRAVKSPAEIEKIRAAVALNDRIWQAAQKRFRPGMTEKAMARIIRKLMIDRGDGEAFETIVCVGANAAECHHVPDETVWDGRTPVLVDLGVKRDGYCSDMTRCLRPKNRRRGLYDRIYQLVLDANEAAIRAVKPGMTGKALDAVARKIIRRGGFGKCFGHSLGHGVGLEIHEAPYASPKSTWTLKPGMLVTIEPGIYLEGNLGVRIEDLVLVTETGCEVLSQSEK